MTVAIAKQKPASFDYTALDSEARIVVKQKTQEIRDRVKTAAEHIIGIGVRLIAVKEHLPHGQFLPWLKSEFEWSESAAVKMMQVGKQFKSVSFTDLTVAPSALYLLAAPSTPDDVRSEFVKKAKAGKPVTHAEVKKAIAEKREDSIDIPVDDEPSPPPPTPVKPAKREPVKDKTGQVIEDPEIAAIFTRSHEIEEFAGSISTLKCTIERQLKGNDELFERMGPLQQVQLEGAYNRAKTAIPYAICPFCRGLKRITNDCAGGCGSTGWMTKMEYQAAVKRLGGK